MAFVIDDAIIASIIAGIASSAIGTGVTAMQAKSADQQQAAIVNRQRQQAAEQRAMTERRQAWLSQQMQQDEALRRQGQKSVDNTMDQMSAEATKKGLGQETSRLADTLGGDTQQAQERVAQDISAATMTAPGKDVAQVLGDDRAAKAKMFGADAAKRMSALAANTAYDTFGQKQNIQLARGADALGLTANFRRGTMDAYQRQMQTLMGGEQAAGAAVNALGNQYVPLDTRMGDIISGVGNMALMYGASRAGAKAGAGKSIF